MDVIHLAANQGKAEAVRAGILAALRLEPDLVGFWDADLATPLNAIDDFLALAAKRPEIDIILGSRVMLMGRDIRREAWRHYLGRVFATGVSLSLNLPVYDTQCGAKVFRANEATAAVFATPFHSPWIFDVEVLARYLAQPAGPGQPARRDADLRAGRGDVASRAGLQAPLDRLSPGGLGARLHPPQVPPLSGTRSLRRWFGGQAPPPGCAGIRSRKGVPVHFRCTREAEASNICRIPFAAPCRNHAPEFGDYQDGR